MKKKFVSNLIYILIVVIIIVIFSILNNNYLPENRRFARIPNLYYILVYLYHVFLGALIGIPKFIIIYKDVQKLKINWYKLLIVGIPSLLLSTIVWFNFLPINSVLMLILSKSNIQFFRVLLGYTIISSFYGIDEEEEY